jgi:hypothetical protein
MVAQRLVSLALVAFVASSCILPIHLQGSVTFAWSIGNASDRKACTARSASTAHVVVRDDVNDIVEDDEAQCDSFRSRYFLDRGWYDASLTLVDVRRSPVSETRRTSAFYVSPRVDTFVEVAFDSAPPPL